MGKITGIHFSWCCADKCDNVLSFDNIVFLKHNDFALCYSYSIWKCQSSIDSSNPHDLGLNSLSGKTYYRQISWSLEAARLDVIMIISLWNLTDILATLLPGAWQIPNWWRKSKPESRGFGATISCGETPSCLVNGSLTSYVKLRVAHAPGMPETFSPTPWVGDPDMHNGTCVKRVPWCIPGSLTSGFLWSRWGGKRSQHSRLMRNPQFDVSGKRPIEAPVTQETSGYEGHTPQSIRWTYL